MLTPAQLLERRKGVGASDAKKIMSGEWHDLWLDKTGRKEPEAILSPWDAAVRHALEPLVMDDYAGRVGYEIGRRGDAVIHPDYDFIRCTLDGFDTQLGPVDAKALNIWTPDPEQWCIDMYTGQMQHQMACTVAAKGALHVSLGMKRPASIYFERDDFFLAEYIEQCRAFWQHVIDDTPPAQGAPMLVEAVAPAQMRKVSMTGDNAWSAAAADWLANKAANKTFDDAVKSLKAKMEADVSEATGHGVTVKRSKDNKLSIKETAK